ncbi:hypothetical protein VNO77_19228 [Canavalia gladiata]|uniref:Uncharacterized protein n=1 Tax=Canavalia gladiata TaxID=3824 RepID=A0AAN9LMC3_CANGL
MLTGRLEFVFGRCGDVWSAWVASNVGSSLVWLYSYSTGTSSGGLSNFSMTVFMIIESATFPFWLMLSIRGKSEDFCAQFPQTFTDPKPSLVICLRLMQHMVAACHMTPIDDQER